jgi:hypothetical protein
MASLDHRGTRFGLGRTPSAYAVLSLEPGGAPVRMFPLTDEAWPGAWRAFHELEATPAETTVAGAMTAEAMAPASTAPEPEAEPGPPPLEEVAVLDYRGEGYGLGRTEDMYAIWDLAAGGRPVETWPIHPAAWRDAWARYHQLEAGVRSGLPEAVVQKAPAVEPELVGAVSVDYTGQGFGLGRTTDAYAIWDLGAGGPPIRTFPLDPTAWPEAWAEFHALQSG